MKILGDLHGVLNQNLLQKQGMVKDILGLMVLRDFSPLWLGKMTEELSLWWYYPHAGRQGSREEGLNQWQDMTLKSSALGSYFHHPGATS